MGLNTILISDLEVVVKRRACPCTKIEILLKSCRDCMLVPVQVWYRYKKCTGTPQPWGTGTNIFGTGTTTSLHVGTGTSKCGIGTTAPTTTPLHCSTTRGLSTAVVINSDGLHLFSEIKPLQKCARDLKTCTRIKTLETIKGTYSTQNESKT